MDANKSFYKLSKDFIDFVYSENNTNNEIKLLNYLDDIIYRSSYISSSFDQNASKEYPKSNYDEKRGRISNIFTDLGFYNFPEDITDKIGETIFIIGDALDDLTDLVQDLEEFIWRYENNSEIDGFWFLHFMKKSHWESHLRNLQLYLFEKFQ